LYQRIVAIDNGDFDLLKIISIAVREMSEGELLQIEKARRLYNRRYLLRDHSKKTATLIAACALVQK
jgi:octaprenyl-diphosphate synthase